MDKMLKNGSSLIFGPVSVCVRNGENDDDDFLVDVGGNFSVVESNTAWSKSADMRGSRSLLVKSLDGFFNWLLLFSTRRVVLGFASPGVTRVKKGREMADREMFTFST